MVRLFEPRFRVTRAEYERVLQEARQQGHKKLAAYFRTRIFGYGFVIEQKILENNKLIRALHEKLVGALPKTTYTTTTYQQNIQEQEA